MSDQTVSASTTVAAPPPVVFAILADPHQHPRIDGSGSVRGVVEGPHRLEKGARFHVSMKLFGLPYKITNTVVEHEPDRRIAWRHFGGHRWRYELEPTADGGTRVTETFDYSRYTGVSKAFIERLGFPERNRQGIEGTLRRLREVAEADAAADPTDGATDVTDGAAADDPADAAAAGGPAANSPAADRTDGRDGVAG